MSENRLSAFSSERSQSTDPPADSRQAPDREIRCEHSRNFAALLSQLNLSVLVSTYQAGKLAVLGAAEGKLTLSFQNFTITVPAGVPSLFQTESLSNFMYMYVRNLMFHDVAVLLKSDVTAIDISAAGGSDFVDGSQISISMIVDAGTGDDTLFGTRADDQLVGGDGDDRMNAGDGEDFLAGNAGNDRMDGGVGADVLVGNGGNDRLRGQDGNDRLYGRAGRDKLAGGGGNDRIYGGAGGDWLSGQGGDDQLFGEGGNDRLSGGAARDIFHGNAGDDHLISNDGSIDELFGDGGNDTATADVDDILRSIEARA